MGPACAKGPAGAQRSELLLVGGGGPERGATVLLNVYSIGSWQALRLTNGLLRRCGTGAFHCGVEVYGAEWSYSFVQANRGAPVLASGVFVCRPRRCENHSYYDTVQMGVTPFCQAEVMSVLSSLRDKWPGYNYNTLTRNCCHFCSELCWRLCVGEVPSWVKSLAELGVTARLDRACCDGVGSVDEPALLRAELEYACQDSYPVGAEYAVNQPLGMMERSPADIDVVRVPIARA